jgi:ABC-type branched-subunit amino acid transport system substrate-binding protein
MSPAELYLAGTVRVVRLQVARPNPTLALLSCDDFAAFEDAEKTAGFAVHHGFEILAPPAEEVLPTPFQRRRINIPGPPGIADVLVFPDGHERFDGLLPILSELDLDLFLMTGHLRESIAFIEHSAAVGFRPRAVGLSVGPALATFRGELASKKVSPEHLFGAAQWTPDVPVVGRDLFITPAEFARAFFERYSMRASYLSAGGYTCGLVLQEAIRPANSLDGEKVRDALRMLSIDTFFAHVEFDHRGLNVTKPMYTIQLRSVGDEFAETILWPPQGAVWPVPPHGGH